MVNCCVFVGLADVHSLFVYYRSQFNLQYLFLSSIPMRGTLSVAHPVRRRSPHVLYNQPCIPASLNPTNGPSDSSMAEIRETSNRNFPRRTSLI